MSFVFDRTSRCSHYIPRPIPRVINLAGGRKKYYRRTWTTPPRMRAQPYRVCEAAEIPLAMFCCHPTSGRAYRISKPESVSNSSQAALHDCRVSQELGSAEHLFGCSFQFSCFEDTLQPGCPHRIWSQETIQGHGTGIP